MNVFKHGLIWLQAGLVLALAGLAARHFTARAAAPVDTVASRSWVVWTAPEMDRVGATDRPITGGAVNIKAARREYQAFQIVVTAAANPVAGVNLEASDLTGPHGSKITRGNLTFYREHYIEVTSPSPDPGRGNRPLGKGWYPDALIPFPTSRTARRASAPIGSAPFTVDANRNQPVWIDVYVPEDARPGAYSGTVRVSAAGQPEVDVPVSLRVWDFTLPLKPALKSSFGLHEPAASDRRVHEVLLRHRIMPTTINPGDARDFERRFGLNTTGLRFWSNSNKSNCTMDPPPSPARIASEMKLYPPDLPVYIYSADEIASCPSMFNSVRDWAANMHAADPHIANLVTIAPTRALYDDGHGGAGVDIWVLLPKMFESDPEAIRDVQARGGEIWSYNDMVQDDWSPKWEIDFPPIDYRIQPGFISQSLGLTGLLYWRVDLWTKAPFEDLRGYKVGQYFYPGEGMLVYPGGPAGVDTVIPSMRLKWIREGIQDFDYIAILKRLGRGDWALSRARSVGADWHHWTKDPKALDSVRDELAEEIERLSPGQDIASARASRKTAVESAR